jgi:hypothetical protein
MKIQVKEYPSTTYVNVGVLDKHERCMHMEVEFETWNNNYLTDRGLSTNSDSGTFCLYCGSFIEPEEDYDD